MSVLDYPKMGLYKLPEKNILVLGCIDLRLTDNLLDFLHFDNLQNRYDQFILAGASLMCSDNRAAFVEKTYDTFHQPWNATFFHHLDIAIELHKIEDVYIVEHESCGAYHHFLKDGKKPAEREKEIELHKKFAMELAHKIMNTKNDKDAGLKYHLNVHCFYLDIRGNVEWMESLYAK